MTVDEVFAEVEKDAVFYRASGGGVTIGGGEVTVWADFAAALLARCRHAGFSTAIETCGHTSWRRLWAVASVADEVLYDVKHLDDATHRQFTGAGTQTIQRNLAALLRRHAAVVVRIPAIPGFNDDPVTIRDIARHLRDIGVTRPVELLPYHRLAVPKYGRLGKEYSLGHLEPPEAAALERLAATVRAEGLQCHIGG
jgi:pyruvate formate lyase activating enzyme